MTVWRTLLRRGSVVLLLVWLTGLVAVFIQRQLTSKPLQDPDLVEPPPTSDGDRPVRIQKGVQFNQTYGPELSFRIAASEGAEYDSGWAELTGVQVTFYSEGRVSYGLTADKGRFHVARKEARTVGETLLSLRGGIAVRAGGFVYKGNELQLDSEGPVALAGPGWAGVAEHARAQLRDDVLELSGGVSLGLRREGESRTLVLLTPRLRYERKRALVVFPEGLDLLQEGLTARAAGARLQLAEEEGEPRRLDLVGPVRLSGQMPDGSPVDGEVGDASVERADDGRLRLAAAAMPTPGWVRVRWLDAVVGWQELVAWRLVGEGTPQAWEWLEGQGQSCGFQVGVAGDGTRRIEAERLRLVFEAGRPASAVATSQVLVESGARWARGGNLDVSLATRAFILLPQLPQRVTIGDVQLDAWCDRLEGAPDGTVVATGKVGGILRRPAGTAGSEGPTRFASNSAELPPGGGAVKLAGDARVWQQDRLVRADLLRYDPSRDEVTGEGQVLTRAPLAQRAGADASELVVRARRLQYRRSAGEMVYEGEVEVDDVRGRARCGRLVVRMDETGKARTVELESGVSVTEVSTGRVLTGQRGRVDVAEDLLEMWGTPVVVKEADGNQIKGDRLAWRRQTGNVVVTGGEDSPSETLYHPVDRTASPTPARRQP
ncbi:MAG: hypothetical protein AB2L07_19390 [Thermoanaerobaculaceae bacterium]